MGFPHLRQRLPLGYSPLNPIYSIYIYIYIWVNYNDLTAASLRPHWNNGECIGKSSQNGLNSG